MSIYISTISILGTIERMNESSVTIDEQIPGIDFLPEVELMQILIGRCVVPIVGIEMQEGIEVVLKCEGD
jgi:hypothetical protein